MVIAFVAENRTWYLLKKVNTVRGTCW